MQAEKQSWGLQIIQWSLPCCVAGESHVTEGRMEEDRHSYMGRTQ